MENFIGISRDIVKHWIYSDSQYFHVWFEMLHRARYSQEPTTELIEGQLVEINYAEFVFGRKKWSEKLGISEQRLRTLIKKLVDEGMIELTSKFNKFSLYRIKNYEKYNQQSNQQEIQSYQDFEHTSNQHNNQQSTIKQPADNQQLTTKEESKERRKKDKKINNNPPISPLIDKTNFGEFVAMTNDEYQKLVVTYGEEFTKRCVEVLDNYKGANGKKYKSDYRAILNWVVDRVAQERRNELAKPRTATSRSYNEYDALSL